MAGAARRICLLGWVLLSLGLPKLQAAVRDVRTYGATGNGITDDSAALYNAIAR